MNAESSSAGPTELHAEPLPGPATGQPDQVLAAVLGSFDEVVGGTPPQGPDTRPDDVESWTSLTHVHLVCEIEARLGVILPEEYLTPRHSLRTLTEAARSASREAGP